MRYIQLRRPTRSKPQPKRQWQSPARSNRPTALHIIVVLIAALGFALGKLIESTLGQILLGIIIIVLVSLWIGSSILAAYGAFFGWTIIIIGGAILLFLLVFLILPLLDAIF